MLGFYSCPILSMSNTFIASERPVHMFAVHFYPWFKFHFSFVSRYGNV